MYTIYTYICVCSVCVCVCIFVFLLGMDLMFAGLYAHMAYQADPNASCNVRSARGDDVGTVLCGSSNCP
eukprot:NODE_8640_length_283_cov_67.730769_g7900_i0.p1 GENE.NODE_8640_length_283_cov_67.730769_g7900_i0~~NODE_8640_length_283_cov_67.730769_g7900_i0.p1  ORF type:complete len:69 (+),score=11.81 NODE_8640_length_283_cov_67.730769_g7900_i0:2-208(+)